MRLLYGARLFCVEMSCAEARMMALACIAVILLTAARSSVPAPHTCGEAIEVPEAT